MNQIEANNFLNNLNMNNSQWAENWCFTKGYEGPCACLGCADIAGGAREAGITEEQWRYWMDKVRIKENGPR